METCGSGDDDGDGDKVIESYKLDAPNFSPLLCPNSHRAVKAGSAHLEDFLGIHSYYGLHMQHTFFSR